MLNKILPLAAAAAFFSGSVVAADAQTMGPAPMANTGSMMGPDHGMPVGTMGGDGTTYLGAPDLQAAISLVTAGGAPGSFSITTALVRECSRNLSSVIG
jgi:hypothetical protein